ncbi:GNAT family N-acetyltransferase [Streptomyces sp. BV286]|uniref:GNAT family N-acetyltransferase n=1 Tax=Streptomyces sp. BV286 TaxID=2849672 RepID=UPI0035A85173
MTVSLGTERLVLRPFTEADVDLLVTLDSDPDVMRFINGGRPADQPRRDRGTDPAWATTHPPVHQRPRLLGRAGEGHRDLPRLVRTGPPGRPPDSCSSRVHVSQLGTSSGTTPLQSS